MFGKNLKRIFNYSNQKYSDLIISPAGDDKILMIKAAGERNSKI